MLPGRAYQKALERRRRSLQLRVVATTLVVSAIVVVLVGLVVASQVRDSILSNKKDASLDQASKTLAAFDATVGKAAQGCRPRTPCRPALEVRGQVGQRDRRRQVLRQPHRHGCRRSVRFLSQTPRSTSVGCRRSTAKLGEAVSSTKPGRAWQYVRLYYADGRHASALAVVQPETAADVTSANAAAVAPGEYKLYLFFPLTTEDERPQPGAGHPRCSAVSA